MPITYEDQLAEYYAVLLDKFADGRLDEAKFERLSDKLDEWETHAERKETSE